MIANEAPGAAGGSGLDRVDAGMALILLVAVSSLFLRTLANGLLIDDSGEFQTMARLLGHTHPTGYELYTLIGRAFATIPLGDFPTRVSALSAVMGGATGAMLYIAARLLGCSKPVSVVPALAVAVAPTFWSQAVIAEVYTSAAVLGLCVLAGLLLWEGTARPRWLVAAGVAGGLSLGVHFTIGLYLPAVVLFLALSARRVTGGGVFSARAFRGLWMPAGAGAVCGIALALAADQIDGVFDRLSFDVTARQFSSLMFRDPGLFARRAEAFSSGLPHESGIPVVVSAVGGLVWLALRRWRTAMLLAVALAIHLVYAFNYDIGDLIYVFYIPAYLLIALLSAVGLTAVVRGVERLRVPSPAPAIVVALLAVAIGILPIARSNLPAAVEGEVPAFGFEGFPYDAFVAETLHPLLTATVRELPEDAIIFLDWEMLYPSYYVAHVEEGRTDLAFHETYAADDQEGVAASLVDYVRAQVRTRPVFVSERIPELEAAGFRVSPVRMGPTPLFSVEDASDPAG